MERMWIGSEQYALQWAINDHKEYISFAHLELLWIYTQAAWHSPNNVLAWCTEKSVHVEFKPEQYCWGQVTMWEIGFLSDCNKNSLFKHRCFDLFLSHTAVCLVDSSSKTTNYWNDKQFLLSITIINAIFIQFLIQLSYILIYTTQCKTLVFRGFWLLLIVLTGRFCQSFFVQLMYNVSQNTLK